MLTSRPRAGATALGGRIHDAGRRGRGGGTPQRRNCAERRSEGEEVRNRTNCQISLEGRSWVCIYRCYSAGLSKHRHTPQDPSRSFPKAFWSSSPLLQGLILIFWRNQSVFRNINKLCCSKLGPKTRDLLRIFG